MPRRSAPDFTAKITPPAFQFYPGDWIASTLGMPFELKGLYIDLLSWSWQNGPLPDEVSWRKRVIGGSARTSERLWNLLQTRWKLTAKGWVNPRLERQRKNSSRARRSWEKRGRGALDRPGGTSRSSRCPNPWPRPCLGHRVGTCPTHGLLLLLLKIKIKIKTYRPRSGRLVPRRSKNMRPSPAASSGRPRISTSTPASSPKNSSAPAPKADPLRRQHRAEALDAAQPARARRRA